MEKTKTFFNNQREADRFIRVLEEMDIPYKVSSYYSEFAGEQCKSITVKYEEEE